MLLVISSAVVFLLWYAFTRDAAQIQPLVPALKSWWMKLHVPANFIGYGTFSLSAMVGFAYLVKQHGADAVLGQAGAACSCWACCCASSPWCSAPTACRPPGWSTAAWAR